MNLEEMALYFLCRQQESNLLHNAMEIDSMTTLLLHLTQTYTEILRLLNRCILQSLQVLTCRT